MENYLHIDFHQTRDFSRKVNATFEFIKQNFKPLVKSILVIAGPPILIASLMMGTIVGDMMNFSTLGVSDPDAFMDRFTSFNFWAQIILVMVFFLVSGVFTIATINNYILLYEEKRTNKIEVHEVWTRVRETFWMYLGTMILFALLAIAAYVVMIVPVVLLAAVSPWLIMLGVMFLIIAIFYFTFSASLVFIIRGYEKRGFMESIFRSFHLVKGKWWSTFGLLMVLYMIAGTISYFFLIPYYIVMVMQMFHTVEEGAAPDAGGTFVVLTMIFFTLYYLVQMILYSLPNVGIAFQYFNLVEMKEAKGLINQIDSIGEAPADTAQDEHY